jgi:hypothetical protein
MRLTPLLLLTVGLVWALVLPGAAARGQAVRGAVAAVAPPFFAGGGNIFDPEIDIIETGAKLDAQAVVSADRKYVTLTMRPQVSTLIALREFTFQRGQALGPVGIPQAGQNNVQNNAPNNARNNGNVAPNAGPAAAGAVRPSVLERPGMTRIEPRAR